MPHTLNVRKRLFKQRRIRYLLAFLMVMSLLLGLLIVPIERSVGNITNSFDGIWWAVSTVTTVGYGDYVPVTDTGKAIGIVLQVMGALMFGILIAMTSNIASRAQDEFYWNRLFERLDRIESQVEELKKRTGFIVKSDDKKQESNKSMLSSVGYNGSDDRSQEEERGESGDYPRRFNH